MKKVIFPLLLACLPMALAAQDCAAIYSYLKAGVTLEYTNYDKKGELQSVMTHHVTRIEEQADTLIAWMEYTGTDKNGKTLYQNAAPIKCYQGVLYMDMRALLPAQPNANQSPDMTVEVEGTELTFPADMQPGQELPNSELTMTTRLGALQIARMHYTITNRKVEARESVTTPAGTFACVKISYDFEYKLLGTRTLHTEYWFSPEVGMVRSVSYDKKGKEDSRMELTKVSKT